MEGEEVDRISELPEGILVSILSLLKLKDAAKTSLLSTRWADLWKLAVTELDFDAPGELLQLLFSKPRLIPGERTKFKNFVNWVVRQLQDVSSEQLTKFRVSFTFTNRCNSDGDIDRWLKFAVMKRVKSLELSFTTYSWTPGTNFPGIDGKYYNFPEDCFDYIKTSAGLSDIKSLRCLRLDRVEIRNETVEHLIANCPYLEELAVHRSQLLVKLRIAAVQGWSLALKRLEVKTCRFLESLEIDNATCLTQFTFSGLQRVELHLKNCVSLVDVFIGFDEMPDLVFDSISSCYASQLVALTVRFANVDQLWFSNPAKLTRLELLTVEIDGPFDKSIIGLVPLINACPRLHTLRLLPSIYTSTPSEHEELPVDRVACKSIKVVEVIGFRGYPIECEFMEYVLECFVGMQRIIVDRNSAIKFCGSPKFPCSKKQIEEARERALEFKSKASSSIDFVVI